VWARRQKSKKPSQNGISNADGLVAFTTPVRPLAKLFDAPLRYFCSNALAKKSYVPKGTLRFFRLRLGAKILAKSASPIMQEAYFYGGAKQ